MGSKSNSVAGRDAATAGAVEAPPDAYGLFRVSSVLAAALLLTFLSDIAGVSRFQGPESAAICLTVLVAGTVVALVGRVLAIWRGLKIAMRNNATRTQREKATLRQGFREMFAYLFVCLGALAAVAFTSAASGAVGSLAVNLVEVDVGAPNPVHVAVFMICLAASFLPLLIGFYLQARFETRQRGQAVLRDDAVSPSTFFVSSLLIGSIVVLAWAAGDRMFTISNDLGVIITGLVILVFLGIILYPHVARFWNNREEARAEALVDAKKSSVLVMAPARWISLVDSVLVRLIAPLSGATQKGPGVPHALLLLVIVPLSAMGYVLASPWGLVPIMLAMLIALALGRRWAWVEDDRETASRLQTTQGEDIHVGFDNDLKDEALLGYASLFVLVPLALHQLQGWTESFRYVETAATGNEFVNWLRFFGAELAKAVPFVDWWEIYDVKIETPYEPPPSAEKKPLAMHLTFAARAMVDLVIMAALFQAIAIWQRRRMQHKLYDSGHLDAFDPFTEADFFENGMHTPQGGGQSVPKKKFVERVRRHAQTRQRFLMSSTPYSERRLSELLSSDKKDVSAGARWMIAEFHLLAGEPHEQLEQLAQRWQVRETNPVVAGVGDSPSGRVALRRAKLEFERVLADLSQPGALSSVGDQQIGYLLVLLETVRRAPEFTFAWTLAIELLGKRGSQFAVLSLARMVLTDEHFAARPEWLERMQEAMGILPHLRQGQQEMRWKVYDSLGEIGTNPEADIDARQWALDLLGWMATPQANGGGDMAAPARVRAAQRASEVLASLSPT